MVMSEKETRRGRPHQRVEWGTTADYVYIPQLQTSTFLTRFGLGASWQMVESVYVAKDNTKAVGVYTVTAERFKGHLTGNPLFQGVLNPEAMAQTWIVWKMHQGEMTEDQTAFFAGIDGFQFRRPLFPGTTVNFGIVKTDNPNRLYGQALVGNDVLTDGYIEAAVVNKKEAERSAVQRRKFQSRTKPQFPFQD